jgi:hypothetical protein
VSGSHATSPDRCSARQLKRSHGTPRSVSGLLFSVPRGIFAPTQARYVDRILRPQGILFAIHILPASPLVFLTSRVVVSWVDFPSDNMRQPSKPHLRPRAAGIVSAKLAYHSAELGRAHQIDQTAQGGQFSVAGVQNQVVALAGK